MDREWDDVRATEYYTLGGWLAVDQYIQAPSKPLDNDEQYLYASKEILVMKGHKSQRDGYQRS